MTPIEWEVWLVDMPFEEGIGSKLRPGLVIRQEDIYYIVGKMTTHPPRDNFPYEYVVRNWKGAGLNRPTTLRLSQMVRLDIGRFRKKLGTIQLEDMVQIRKILKSISSQ